MSGILYGIGVGPGDPELLTIKAARLIENADLIAYPAPEIGDSFARSIAAPYIRPGTPEHAIRMNIGDGTFPKDDIYTQAAEYLKKETLQGKKCVVLCEGDPLFYGSFYYLLMRLSGNIKVELVPGVSSLMACASLTGKALVHGQQSLSILPAIWPEDRLRKCLAHVEAAAIVKLGKHLPKIRRILSDMELTPKTHYIERATLPGNRVVPLASLEDINAPYFSMLLIGNSY